MRPKSVGLWLPPGCVPFVDTTTQNPRIGTGRNWAEPTVLRKALVAQVGTSGPSQSPKLDWCTTNQRLGQVKLQEKGGILEPCTCLRSMLEDIQGFRQALSRARPEAGRGTGQGREVARQIHAYLYSYLSFYLSICIYISVYLQFYLYIYIYVYISVYLFF